MAKEIFREWVVIYAPKMRTCEIVDNMKNLERGIYTGSIGYFSYSGTMNFNICIRTIEMNEEQLRFGAGGAIVIDSIPEDEYEEILIKSKFVFDTL